MTEQELRYLEAKGGKTAELVRRYRDLHFVVRQARRLGAVADEALVRGEVDPRALERPSGQFMCFPDGS